MEIPLKTVVVDDRARDGTWCTLPYPRHPKGCVKYPKCRESRPHFHEYPFHSWTAIVFRFDLGAHAEEMKKRPRKDKKEWTDPQARCVLYWQEHKVRKPLMKMAEEFSRPGDVILDVPEANGVDVFTTMKQHGLTLERDPQDIVYKIMLVGRPISGDGVIRDCGAVGHGCEDCYIKCDDNPRTQEEDFENFMREYDGLYPYGDVGPI